MAYETALTKCTCSHTRTNGHTYTYIRTTYPTTHTHTYNTIRDTCAHIHTHTHTHRYIQRDTYTERQTSTHTQHTYHTRKNHIEDGRQDEEQPDKQTPKIDFLELIIALIGGAFPHPRRERTLMKDTMCVYV